MKRQWPRAITGSLPLLKLPLLEAKGKSFTLRNLSEEGVGIWTRELSRLFSSGESLPAKFHLNGKLYKVSMEVMHLTKGVVGLKFLDLPKRLKQALRELLEPAALASELRPHNDNGTEDPEVGYPRLWYQSESGCELMIWYHATSGMVVALQLCWLGNWVFRKHHALARTGSLVEGSQLGKGLWLENHDEIEFHDSPEPDLLNTAAILLSSLSKELPGHQLWQFLETGEQVFLDLSRCKRPIMSQRK